MSAEIEVVNGQAKAVFAHEVPWHGLGTIVESELTYGAAIKLAGLDTICEKRPLYIKGEHAVDGIPVIGREVPDMVGVVRVNDNKILGVVSPDYEIIQNHECFEFLDEIVGSGQAIFHSAASLFGGSVIFCTVKFSEGSKIGDDKIDRYILLYSSHNRRYSMTAFWTPTRVVCANTLSLAIHGQRGDGQNKVVVRHVKGYKARVEEARRVLELNEQYYKVMEDQFNRLLDQKFTDEEMNKFAEDLFPVKEGKKLAGVTKNNRDEVIRLFNVGAGNAKVAHTKWAALNAVAEYTDHFATVRPSEESNESEYRLRSISFGGGATLKQKAFDLLTV